MIKKERAAREWRVTYYVVYLVHDVVHTWDWVMVPSVHSSLHSYSCYSKSDTWYIELSEFRFHVNNTSLLHIPQGIVIEIINASVDFYPEALNSKIL